MPGVWLLSIQTQSYFSPFPVPLQRRERGELPFPCPLAAEARPAASVQLGRAPLPGKVCTAADKGLAGGRIPAPWPHSNFSFVL